MKLEQEPLHRLFDQSDYALVAAEQKHRLPENLRARAVAGGPLADSQSLAPVLVELRALQPHQRKGLLDALDEAQASTEQPATCTLLSSPAAAEDLVRHLSAQQIRLGPQGERAWLRLHDPRVWIQLTRVLDSQEMNRLLGPVETWRIWLHGHWVSSVKEPVGQPAPRHSTREVWAALGRIGIVNRVLARSGLAAPEEVAQHSEPIDRLVQRAIQHHGLERIEDLVEYACLGMRVHVEFDAHPDVVRWITRHAGQNENVVDILNAMPDEDWLRIGRDLHASQHGGRV